MGKKVKVIEGGVCTPKGFKAGAIACGIKNPAVERLDLTLIYSEFPTVGAAVYTQNQVCAAPVRLSSSYLKSAEPRAIIANSGNANACTGPQGLINARTMTAATAKALGLKQREVQVCSTGIIGVPLPIDRIEPRIPELVAALGSDGGVAARAIMTSDTCPKEIAVQVKIGDVKVMIGAIAKGAGMINPHMATMLCFITTDAAISKAEIVAATKEAVDLSFNRITVDGDMSTNDTVIVMANGQAGNKTITRGGEGSAEFREALTEVMLELAKRIVSDGERVTKLVEVQVRGAASNMDAERVARAVANSKLVKCSWNGNDPNWGRILHAVGYSGARVKEEMVNIHLNGVIVTQNGLSAGTDGEKLIAAVSGSEFTVGIDLNLGKGAFTIYTSDLSPEYVDFNRTEYSAVKKK
ncbi:MAG: bifunctional glutamate N-acetyltransferase/amino-acid acetyltransferase ArgJ [Verrucomicrobiales bacterium]|jgi:glutamate N-acetyltransferase/amino-acid N-acetyltransferase|nr:bifunctional glutamate N-acetyltransferase/amino-acid acetyltransferase ArgJ [Verrucomicrobiales bacterium]